MLRVVERDAQTREVLRVVIYILVLNVLVAAAQPWHGCGQVQGPGVFMFGRPPPAFCVHAGQFPNGTFPLRSGRTGKPSAASRWAVCRCSLMLHSDR